MWHIFGRDGESCVRFHQTQRKLQVRRGGARHTNHQVCPTLLPSIVPYDSHVKNLLSFASIDVLQLIEEAVEGSWIGHRARLFSRQQESEIGSLYAPPRQDGSGKRLVEIVIEIGDREDVSDLHGAPFSCTVNPFRMLMAQCRDGFLSLRREVFGEY